jgi:aspartate-semialdehyde dehydrogenase
VPLPASRRRSPRSHKRFGVESAIVTTLQAISGAGYPGVSSFDITDNVIAVYRWRRTESGNRSAENLRQDSLTAQSRKRILPFQRAMFSRADVLDGHTVSVRVNLREDPRRSKKSSKRLKTFPSLEPPFVASEDFISDFCDEPSRPQPRLDRDNGNEMTITVGQTFSRQYFRLSLCFALATTRCAARRARRF